MRRRCSSCAASAARGVVVLLGLAGAVGHAAPGHAATVLQQTIRVSIGADDRVVTTTSMRVRLDGDGDYEAWSPYGIWVDEHIDLDSIEGGVEHPTGKKETLSRRDFDTQSGSPGWVTHASGKVRSVRFPRAAAGAVLWLDYRTLTRPYFPTFAIPLGAQASIERLDVEVTSAKPLRWVVTGEFSGLGATVDGAAPAPPAPLAPLTPNASADARRITLSGRWTRPAPAPHSASSGTLFPTLLLTWSPSGEWAELGPWWTGLMASVPRGGAPVRALAAELAPASLTPRQRLERLLAFARSEIRYVAVEVGVGGYRAASPGETLDRRWGDCKAKAVLLADLLSAAGLEGYPVLVMSGADERIEPRLADPGAFNHMILAVPAQGIAEGGDPVAEGLLFVDPTSPRAAVGWLHPGVQDQDVVVIQPSGARLVRTPIVSPREHERLEAVLRLGEDGSASGPVALKLTGELGAAFLEIRAAGDPLALERAVRGSFERRLPGFRFEQLSIGVDEASPAPSVHLRAEAAATSFSSRAETSVALSLAGDERTPPASVLDGRTTPVVAEPGVTERVFVLELPAGWQVPAAEETSETSAVGTFRQRILVGDAAPNPRSVVVERRTEVTQRWIESGSFSELRKLSLAEHRAARRRLRFDVRQGSG